MLDLKGGQAVHAVAGNRSAYRPLVSRYHPEPDPVALARGLRDRLGVDEIYLADLDAIVTRAEPSWATFRALADLGLQVWADIGIEDAPGVGRLIESGVGRVVVGLETIAGPAALGRVVATVGSGRIVLSLDLRDGVPILPSGHAWRGDPRDPANLTGQAVAVGVRAILRLDLASVGTGGGVASIPPAPTASWPGVEWSTGGGVAGPGDLKILAGRGYAAVLVGSALHDGRLGSGGDAAQGFAGSGH